MESTIKVRMDYETAQPVIRITRNKQSDDERDRMINFFLEKASIPGNVLYTTFPNGIDKEDVVEIRCEKLVGTHQANTTLDFDPFDVILRARNLANELTTNSNEAADVNSFFDGMVAKASLRLDNIKS